MELRKSEGQKEEEDCLSLINKRLKQFEHLNKVFTEPVFWLNSIKISYKDIIEIQSAELIQSLSLDFLTLSLNLAKFTDSYNYIEFIKSILLVFEEYSQYCSKEKKLSSVQFRTNQPLLHLFHTNKSVLGPSYTPKWKKSRQLQNSLVFTSLLLPDNELPISTLSMGTSMIEYSSTKTKDLGHSKDNFSILTIINAPIDLSLNDIICQLCETLSKIYKKFENNEASEMNTQIKKIDNELKKLVLYVLYDVINNTAIQLMKSTLQLIITH